LPVAPKYRPEPIPKFGSAFIGRKPWGWQLRVPTGGSSSCSSLAYAPDAAGWSARDIRSRTTPAERRWCFVSPPALSGGIASKGGGSTRPLWIQAARRVRAQCRYALSTAMGKCTRRKPPSGQNLTLDAGARAALISGALPITRNRRREKVFGFARARTRRAWTE
jgi:hypothetical protein